jgi:hypothetical protein
MSAVLSTMPLSEWRGDVTFFNGNRDPLPADEIVGASFDTLVHRIAGEHSLAIGPEKEKLPYFVPCQLKDAPLTVNMRARVGVAVGKQRSAAHMTVACYLVPDIDGLPQEQFDSLLSAIRAAGLSHLVFSTYSHGKEGKGGIRARLVVPVDRPLNADEYRAAWLGFDQLFCGGAIAAADASGKAIGQQQGVWATSEGRVDMAFRIVHKAGVAATAALIAEGMKVCKPKVERREPALITQPVTVTVARLKVALPYLDSEATPVWISLMMAWKALASEIGFDVAQALAVEYSERSPECAKAKNDDPRYDPEMFFENCSPTMTADVAKGFIYGLAKAGATTVMLADKGKCEWSEAGHDAALYLCKFHQKHFEQITGGAT